MLKRTNPLDRRGVLLSVAPAGRLAVDRVSAEIRAVNDLFFGALDAASFAALSAAAGALVESSARRAIHRSVKGAPQSLRDAGDAGMSNAARDAEQMTLWYRRDMST